MGLLTGVRVLGVEHCGAGLHGTQLLADLGGEVVKVENGAAGRGLRMLSGPIKVNGAKVRHRCAPLLGEHDEDCPRI